MRILIVEDEADLRESLRVAFTSAGFRVDVAADGEAGLFVGLENPLDAIVLDLGLPKLDGLKVLCALRARQCDVPVLVLTSRGHWQDTVQLESPGAPARMLRVLLTEYKEGDGTPLKSTRRVCGPSSPPSCIPQSRASL